MNKAIIIGGGVIGLSTAYHLALRRFGKIVVLEKGHIGEGSSRRAAGITTGLLWTETGVRARQIGLKRFREISLELPGYTFHDEQGCLNIFSPELWPQRQELLPLYDRLAVNYEILNGMEIRDRWPDLQPPRHTIGLHDPHGGYSEPDEYLEALASQLKKMNVIIREEESVRDFCVEQGRLTGVKTDSEKIQADAIICTVHVWSLPLLSSLDLKFPIKQFVHQRYLSAPLPRTFLSPPVNADPYGGYLRPAAGQRLLMGLETPARMEWPVTSKQFKMTEVTPPSADFLAKGSRRFESLAPILSSVIWEKEDVGLLSFSMDGEPILGPVRDLPGLYVAVSFHSGGFSYNTAAGLFLAEWLTKNRTSIDLSAFSPNRFQAEGAEKYLATTLTQKELTRRRH